MRQWSILLCATVALGCNHAGNTADDEPQKQGSTTVMHDHHAPAATTSTSSQPPKPLTARTSAANSNPCLLQHGREVPENRLRIIGTEPFWSAVVEGRCITYSTPETQSGVRIWTAFSGSWNEGRWTGSLGKKRFLLVTKPDRLCSDGMSDRRYPLAVTLTIGREKRRGCAAPE